MAVEGADVADQELDAVGIGDQQPGPRQATDVFLALEHQRRIADLPPELGRLVEEELASREFMPEIEKILEVSSFACPSTWQVATNRGGAALILKGEEDIRRLSQTRLLIADTHGIQFLVRDIAALDRHSRKLLDRFL